MEYQAQTIKFRISYFSAKVATSELTNSHFEQKPFTEDASSEGSNILVWFGNLYVLCCQ
jgi:hypothetical protein